MLSSIKCSVVYTSLLTPIKCDYPLIKKIFESRFNSLLTLRVVVYEKRCQFYIKLVKSILNLIKVHNFHKTIIIKTISLYNFYILMFYLYHNIMLQAQRFLTMSIIFVSILTIFFTINYLNHFQFTYSYHYYKNI